MVCDLSLITKNLYQIIAIAFWQWRRFFSQSDAHQERSRQAVFLYTLERFAPRFLNWDQFIRSAMHGFAEFAPNDIVLD